MAGGAPRPTETRAAPSGTVDCALLVPFIERFRAEGGSLDSLPGNLPRVCRLILAGDQRWTCLDKADRLLLAMNYSPARLNDVAPMNEEAA